MQGTKGQLTGMLDALLQDLGPGGCLAPGTASVAGPLDFRLEGRLGLLRALVERLQAFHLTVAGGQLLAEHLLTGEIQTAV